MPNPLMLTNALKINVLLVSRPPGLLLDVRVSVRSLPSALLPSCIAFLYCGSASPYSETGGRNGAEQVADLSVIHRKHRLRTALTIIRVFGCCQWNQMAMATVGMMPRDQIRAELLAEPVSFFSQLQLLTLHNKGKGEKDSSGHCVDPRSTRLEKRSNYSYIMRKLLQLMLNPCMPMTLLRASPSKALRL